MSTDRSAGIGPVTTRYLLAELTDLREDIQAQSVILAEMDTALRQLFAELRRANVRMRHSITAMDVLGD